MALTRGGLTATYHRRGTGQPLRLSGKLQHQLHARLPAPAAPFSVKQSGTISSADAILRLNERGRRRCPTTCKVTRQPAHPSRSAYGLISMPCSQLPGQTRATGTAAYSDDLRATRGGRDAIESRRIVSADPGAVVKDSEKNPGPAWHRSCSTSTAQFCASPQEQRADDSAGGSRLSWLPVARRRSVCSKGSFSRCTSC